MYEGCEGCDVCNIEECDEYDDIEDDNSEAQIATHVYDLKQRRQKQADDVIEDVTTRTTTGNLSPTSKVERI